MNKKLILISAGVGIAGFIGAFATGWFTTPAKSAAAAAPETPKTAAATPPSMLAGPTLPAAEGANPLAMTQDQLQELIGDVRDAIQEYNNKLASLEKEKERFRVAQQTLKKDVDTLNNLRTELATAMTDLKNEREMLQKTRVQIEQSEKNNLVAIASAYDKMDAARASEILTSMAKSPSNGGGRGSSVDDAVKILHYMQERTKAKVLGEMVTTEPALAAQLCQKLKQVTEVD